MSPILKVGRWIPCKCEKPSLGIICAQRPRHKLSAKINFNESRADLTDHHLPSSYGSSRVRDSMLIPTQPDLIDPVRRLTRLNADRVISGVL